MHWKSVLPLFCLVPFSLLTLPRSSRAEPVPGKGDKPQGKSSAILFAGQIKPLLAKYCFDCHGESKPKADLNLKSVADETAILKDRKLWGRLVEYVEAGEMPPEDRPQPTEAEVE